MSEQIEKKSAGEILKQARLEQGLSLQTIHEGTKIPLDALRGIEEGYHPRTLTPFYVKGFIKMYAKYLDVNVDDVITEPQPKAKVKKEDPKPPKKEILDDIDIQLWISRIFTKKRKKHILVGLGILVALFVLFKIITAFTHKKPSVKTAESVRVAKVEPVKSVPVEKKITKKIVPEQKTVETVIPKPVKKVPVKATPPPKPQTQKEVKPVMLSVRALKKGWLTVKADDVTVFRSSIGEGEVESWLADEKIEISGNIINQLEFELNDKLIGPLGRKDRRAKRVVITKDGLKVSK